MKIDLHIHSNTSDGRMPLESIFEEAHRREIRLISITDHDAVDAQESAKQLAHRHGMAYIYGLELNITFSHPGFRKGKGVSLDLLAYGFDIHNRPLVKKLRDLKAYREKRAELILEKINAELLEEKRGPLTHRDLEAIQGAVDGTFGRPHIAAHMVEKGLVVDTQEAFDRYLVKCNVPKMPVSLPEASELIRKAGGKLLLAHPNHPRGTSLIALTPSLKEQQEIIEQTMLPLIDGVECWHSAHDAETTASYIDFAKKRGLMVSGGSDCHQNPVLMGTVNVPPWVAKQFGFDLEP
ncbi:MAG: PHP domain-containing protein [Deltaproteobacteria bacterium]|jgi:predicted metal-dependent phosphoesterase TrpH